MFLGHPFGSATHSGASSNDRAFHADQRAHHRSSVANGLTRVTVAYWTVTPSGT